MPTLYNRPAERGGSVFTRSDFKPLCQTQGVRRVEAGRKKDRCVRVEICHVRSEPGTARDPNGGCVITLMQRRGTQASRLISKVIRRAETTGGGLPEVTGSPPTL